MWLDIWDDPMKALDNPTTFDLETTIRNQEYGKMKASPFHPDNHIVCIGWKTAEMGDAQVGRTLKAAILLEEAKKVDSILLVGQNIKFDLLWLIRNNPEVKDHLHKFCIWDTQLAEYLLTGQDHKMASLDELATKYGGTVKDDRIKEFWKAGVDTVDIPWDMLEEYQKYDVVNTELVFWKQLEQVVKEGLLNLTMSQMDALLATTEMEYNGLVFDKSLAMELAKPLQEEIVECESLIKTAMVAMGFPEDDLNVGSVQQISKLFFGGEHKYKERDYILDEEGNKTYYKGGAKKGEPKMKLFDKVVQIPAMCSPVTPKGKNGCYPVGDDILKKVKKKHKDDEVVQQLIDAILKYRKLSKDVNTYYIGYSQQVFPDGKLHGNFNHTSTGTGRLSSSNPNLQNISN